MNFSEKLENAIRKKNSCIILGIDPSVEKMPNHIPKTPEGIFIFCKQIIDACEEKICGVILQMAYFEIFGAKGILIAEQLITYAKEKKLITIADGKRNDIGPIAEAYAKAYLTEGPLSVDALTVNAYSGDDGILPFVKLCEENDRGLFILVHTSNPSAKEIQDKTEVSITIAEKIEEWNISTQSPKNLLSSVGAIVEATNSDALKFFREEMPHSWILTPGVGEQDAKIEEALKIRKNGLGILIPITKPILYESEGKDFAEKAKEEIQKLWEAQKL